MPPTNSARNRDEPTATPADRKSRPDGDVLVIPTPLPPSVTEHPAWRAIWRELLTMPDAAHEHEPEARS